MLLNFILRFQYIKLIYLFQAFIEKSAVKVTDGQIFFQNSGFFFFRVL